MKLIFLNTSCGRKISVVYARKKFHNKLVFNLNIKYKRTSYPLLTKSPVWISTSQRIQGPKAPSLLTVIPSDVISLSRFCSTPKAKVFHYWNHDWWFICLNTCSHITNIIFTYNYFCEIYFDIFSALNSFF